MDGFDYRFDKLFVGGDASSAKVVEGIKKLFYVYCTRTMSQLAVYYVLPSDEVVAKAKEWYGSDNMVNMGE